MPFKTKSNPPITFKETICFYPVLKCGDYCETHKRKKANDIERYNQLMSLQLNNLAMSEHE